MKRIIITVLITVLPLLAFAQDYYTATEIPIDNEILFQVGRYKSGGIGLDNKKDPVIDINTGNLEITDIHSIWRKNSKINGNNVLLNAFYAAFTPTEIANIADQSIEIYWDWDNNGNIVRLEFLFRGNPKMLSIPPSKFAILYKELKKNVKFKVVEPRFNYNTMITTVKMSKVKNRELILRDKDYY